MWQQSMVWNKQIHICKVFLSHLQHGCFLLTYEHTNVRVAQIRAVYLTITTSGVNMREGFIDLQRPDALIVNAVRGDTPLLTQRPESNRPVWASRKTLSQHTADQHSWTLKPFQTHMIFDLNSIVFVKHTWVPSLFNSSDFTLSVCPFSFISLAQVRGSHTLRTWHNQ